MKNSARAVIWIVGIALVVWGGHELVKRPAGTAAEKEPIKIGGAFALTGDAAAWGESERNAVTMAIDEANQDGGIHGRPIELISENTFSENQRTVSAIAKLTDIDHVVGLLGPTWLDTYGGASPSIEKSGIVTINPSGAVTAVQAPVFYPHIFSTYYRSDKELEELARRVAVSGKKKVALLLANDTFWRDAGEHFKIGAASSGIRIIDETYMNPDQGDFRTPIARLKAIDPDAVVIGFNGEKGWINFLKQRTELGFMKTVYTQESIEEFARKKEYAELFGDVHFIAPKILESDFGARYKKRFGANPVFSTSNAYDGARILIEAIRAAGTETESITAYLKTHAFDTVTFGEAKFDEINGLTGGEFVMKDAPIK